MKFSIENLGCKVNAYEAESTAEILEEEGWTRVKPHEEADAVIIFTCAVTNTAAGKSRKALHRARRENPDGITVVAGCYVQVDDEHLLDTADIIVGTADKKRIPDLIRKFQKDHQKIRDIPDLGSVSFDDLPYSVHDSKARCDLKIQDGCNQFCSYCIIPYARGRERSMNPDEAVRAAEEMSHQYREIVLTGIHTGRYGREYGVSLAQLMKRMLDVIGDTRLRISSIEVTEVSDELIDLIRSDERVARFLHIPLQSGSDSVLKRMRRPYDTKYYYDRITRVRNAVPDISISCDIMTGFPQETDEEAEESEAFVRKCGFSFLHVFPFSPRKGTVAEKMPCQVSPEVKKQRTDRLLSLSRKLYDTWNMKQVGKEADIICEWVRDGYTTGHTSQYVPVRINEELVHGEKVHVLMTEYRNHQMYARKTGKSE